MVSSIATARSAQFLQAIEARPGTYACLVRSRPTGSLIGVPTCRFSDSLTVVSEHLRSHSFECASLAQFLNVPRPLGLGSIVINTGRWCYPDKRCFQPHSLAHVDGTFTVAEPHFLTSFHRHIRWGAQHQLINFKLVDQCWRPLPRFVGITCTRRRRPP